ncbi:MAG: hypothetical protein V1873_06340 [Verrucomicrobiota bacterium]
METGREIRRFTVVATIALCVFLAVSLLVLQFIPHVIQAMYDKLSLGFLNRIIEGHDVHSIDYYVDHARMWFTLFVPMLAVCWVILVVLLFWRRFPRIAGGLSWLLPLALYVAHAALFARFIVDDAGISFAYAKNLAHGQGLVPQPGAPPVEGYSNPLWVLVFALISRLNLLALPWTPKIVSLVLVAASYRLCWRILRDVTPHHRFVSFAALSLLSTSTSFVIWTSAGLENPLYVFLVLLLCRQVQMATGAPAGSHPHPVALGVICGLIALTRPEGVMFLAAYPLVLTLVPAARQRGWWKPALLCVLGFAVIYGSYGLFRLAYFGDLLPNTYYAKSYRGSSAYLAPLLSGVPLVKVFHLVRGAGGLAGVVAFGAAVVLLLFGELKKRGHAGYLALLAATGISALPHALLPDDWMPEYRFATPFFPLLYMTLGLAAAAAYDSVRDRAGPWVRPALRWLLALLIAGSFLFYWKRSYNFCIVPAWSLQRIKERQVDRSNEYARRLGVHNGSVLLGDVGAAMLYSNLRVIDLGGLCNKPIAKLFHYRGDRQAFYDYVFEEARPTFICTYRTGTFQALFDSDPRFRRDYLPLYEYNDPWVEYFLHKPWQSGDYVRKDAIQGKEKEVGTIQEELAESQVLLRD